jgi:isoquinoline 1-oxidoreductase alpha subunit
MTAFVLNGKKVTSTAQAGTPLLWVIRDEFNLTGTKFGCGISMCGACTVHLNGAPTRACVTPVERAAGAQVVTIEGLAPPNAPHPLQKAWVDQQVPQCGYCQSGQIMSAAALLKRNPHPTDEEIIGAMNGNLCRCMAYVRIMRAIKTVAAATKSSEMSNDKAAPG